MSDVSGSDKNVDSRRDGKRVFNKKKWREEKYSIKAKVKRWEEKRKKNLLRKYHKELKKDGVNINKNTLQKNKNLAVGPVKTAHLRYKQIQEEKKKKKEERERIKKERDEALKAYKEKKAARFIKLSQKTRKGQPLMRGRIELLLEQIEKNYSNHNS